MSQGEWIPVARQTTCSPHSWRIVVAYAIVTMAFTDAADYMDDNIRVEVWVILLSLIVIATLFLSATRFTARLSCMGWFVGCLLCLYNVTWFVTEYLAYQRVFTNVSVYPFGFNIPGPMFWIAVGMGALLIGMFRGSSGNEPVEPKGDRTSEGKESP